ncbi:MAG: DUF1674 domain-containing protein [Alphaproteobacteria bacterium]|nr:DUF1674 domain-containing protein [Alphaproteobacteria bacterium]
MNERTGQASGQPGAFVEHRPASKPAPGVVPPAGPAAESPKPGAAKPDAGPRPDPTRYGDWEVNGRCIDF